VVDFIWLGFGRSDYSWWLHLKSTVNKFWYLKTAVHGYFVGTRLYKVVTTFLTEAT